jgi:hypothetical protein
MILNQIHFTLPVVATLTLVIVLCMSSSHGNTTLQSTENTTELSLHSRGLAGTIYASNDDDLICNAFRKSFYSTTYERHNHPCQKCSFDSTRNELFVECFYDYCKECSIDADICGHRVVKLQHKFIDEQDIFNLIDGQHINFITMEYCIDYVEGYHDGMVCVTIGKYFPEQQCTNNEHFVSGPPLLSCDETSGCDCYQKDDSIDPENPFVGFAALSFQTCYDPSVTSLKTLAEERVVLSSAPASRTACFSGSFIASLLLYVVTTVWNLFQE